MHGAGASAVSVIAEAAHDYVLTILAEVFMPMYQQKWQQLMYEQERQCLVTDKL